MNTIDKLAPLSILEEWRNHLNSAIIQSEFNLSDTNLVDLSGRVDIMIFSEMLEAETNEEISV